MTINEARELILARFEAAWGDESDFTFDNEAFAPNESDPYVKVSIRHSTSGQETLGGPGGRKFLRRGLISLEIRTPADTGTEESDRLSTLFIGIFEAVTFSEVRCYDALPQELGTNGKWHLATVDVIFEYDETK